MCVCEDVCETHTVIPRAPAPATLFLPPCPVITPLGGSRRNSSTGPKQRPRPAGTPKSKSSPGCKEPRAAEASSCPVSVLWPVKLTPLLCARSWAASGPRRASFSAASIFPPAPRHLYSQRQERRCSLACSPSPSALTAPPSQPAGSCSKAFPSLRAALPPAPVRPVMLPGSTSNSCHLQLPNSSLQGSGQPQARQAQPSSGTPLPAQAPGQRSWGRASAALPAGPLLPSHWGQG